MLDHSYDQLYPGNRKTPEKLDLAVAIKYEIDMGRGFGVYLPDTPRP
jgi:hypothetical protein